MSRSPNPPVAGTSQIWNNFKAIDGDEDTAEVVPRTSLYVDVFQSIHDIVMEQEKFLFSSEELACLQKLNRMGYAARYLLIRLCLRKRGKWHGLANLEQRYKIEIGGKEQISQVIDELCGITRETGVKVKDEEPEVIDLTQEENEDSDTHPASRTHNQASSRKEHGSASRSTPQHRTADEIYVLAEDDANASLPELLGCLTYDELKSIGKQIKVTKPGQHRSSLSDAIVSNSSDQTTLTFSVLTPHNIAAKATGKPMQQFIWSFPKDSRSKQTTVVRRLVSKSIGRCIRISHTLFTLFDRLNLVFFRSTVHNSPLLLPALLTAFRKRCQADTHYVRTAGVFSSRQALLDYEEALALEARVDEALSGQTPAIAHRQSPSQNAPAWRNVKTKQKELRLSINPRVEAAKIVREIWADVYDRWRILVALKGEQERPPGIERFDCGYVLTRIVSKGAEALAILKEHDLEMDVLNALLAQTKWRRGRRGAWYDRLALVLMAHSEKTQETLKMAMDVVIDGLHDGLTHLIYRPRLERRLTRLEKMLNVAMNERHKCDGQLQKARDVYIEGVRIKNRVSSVIWDKSKGVAVPLSTGRSKSETPFTICKASSQSIITQANESFKQSSQSWKGKTLWIGKHGGEISVEQFALEYYYGLGFKGFHSEGRIVSTIFGLLFWDVIFASVPGAFETPFQSAPLDIFEDAFYLARRELIDQRLAALENGEAHDLLEQVLKRERPHRTSCIGVDWDFQPEDLLDIVDCLGGHALAVICQMICEEYGQWQGGVPDLLIWNIETFECRFVEVKSPNDRLQENQKVWIDVLVGSETPVDLCHVVEKGEKGKGRKGSRTCSNIKDTDISSNAVSDDGVESELKDMDQLQAQNPVKHDRDSDEFIPSLAKKRKVEVT